MEVINPAFSLVHKILGKQHVNTTAIRPFTYSYMVEYDNHALLYNLVTRELVLLTSDEKKAYDDGDFTNQTISGLIERWFLVGKDFE